MEFPPHVDFGVLEHFVKLHETIDNCDTILESIVNDTILEGIVNASEKDSGYGSESCTTPESTMSTSPPNFFPPMYHRHPPYAHPDFPDIPDYLPPISTYSPPAIGPSKLVLRRAMMNQIDEEVNPRKRRMSSRMQGVPKSKRQRKPEPLTDLCRICGDLAPPHNHYGGIACFSCRAFFGRTVHKQTHIKYRCIAANPIGYGKCEIVKSTRTYCQFCRFKKCLDYGMKPAYVTTADERRAKRCQKEGRQTADEQTLRPEDVEEIDDLTRRWNDSWHSQDIGPELLNRLMMQGFGPLDPDSMCQLNGVFENRIRAFAESIRGFRDLPDQVQNQLVFNNAALVVKLRLSSKLGNSPLDQLIALIGYEDLIRHREGIHHFDRQAPVGGIRQLGLDSDGFLDVFARIELCEKARCLFASMLLCSAINMEEEGYQKATVLCERQGHLLYGLLRQTRSDGVRRFSALVEAMSKIQSRFS